MTIQSFCKSLLGPLLGPKGSIRRRHRSGIGWSAVSSLSLQCSLMLSGIFVARKLDPVGYGAFNLVKSSTLLLSMFAGAGLSLSISSYIAEARSNAVNLAQKLRLFRTSMLLTGTAVTIAGAFGAPLIAASLLHQPQLALALLIVAPTLFTSSYNGFQTGLVSGLERYDLVAAFSMIDGLLLLVFPVAGAALAGLAGSLIGISLAGCIGCFAKQLMIDRTLARLNVSLNGWPRESFGPILKGLLPALLIGVVLPPFEWRVRVMLSAAHNGLAEFGLFNVATSWGQLVTFIPAQLCSPLVPMISQLWGAGKTKHMDDLIRNSVIGVTVTAFAIGATLLFSGSFLLRLYGASYADAAGALQYVAIAYAIGAITQVYRAIFFATGRAWKQLAYVAGYGVILLTSFSFVPNRTSESLALCYIISFACLAAVQHLDWRFARRKQHHVGDPPLQSVVVWPPHEES